MTKSTVLAPFIAMVLLTPAQAGCIQFGGKDPCDSGALPEAIMTTPQQSNIEPVKRKNLRQIGSALSNRDNNGNAWSIQRLGDNFFVRDANGSSKRCNQFGEQLVCY